MLTRRHFLQGSLLGSLLGVGCGEGTTDARPARATLPPAGPPFPTSIVRASRAEVEGTLTVISGTVPTDMLGYALAVGAIPEGGGTPLFTGDGMVYRLGFEGGTPTLKTRLIRTDDFLLDEATLNDPQLAYKSAGMARLSPAFGGRNFANTALTPIANGRLIASYDAGRPWEIDPATLDVLTPVGKQSTWRASLPPMSPGLSFMPIHMSTAHPAWDPDEGVLYVVNYAPPMDGLEMEPFLHLLRWDTKAEPIVTTLREKGGNAILRQSCHQMHVTKHHVVLCDGAFRIEPEQMAGRDVSHPQASTTTLFVVPKDALRAGGEVEAVRVEIPIEAVHFLVDREDTPDRLTLLLLHQNSADPSEWVRANDRVHGTGQPVNPDDVGMLVANADLVFSGRYEIDLRTGKTDDSRTKKLIDPRLWTTSLWTSDVRKNAKGFGSSFVVAMGFAPELLTERIVSMYADHPSRIVPVSELPKDPLPAQLLRVDHDAMSIEDAFAFPIGSLPFSPTFVPRKNGGIGEGYVVVFVVGPETDEIWIFASSDLRDGPLCRLRHNELDFGFTLHTAWMEGIASSASSLPYRVGRRDDYSDRLTVLTPKARELATRVLGL